jgi:hypothetical protein
MVVMRKKTPVTILAEKIGWSRQRLQYYLKGGNKKPMPMEIAALIEKESGGLFRAVDLRKGYKETAKTILGAM